MPPVASTEFVSVILKHVTGKSRVAVGMSSILTTKYARNVQCTGLKTSFFC